MGFQSVSNTMRGIAEHFEQKKLTKISKKIRRLQDFEKDKMNLTIDMQQQIVTARPPKNHSHNDKNGHDEYKHHDCEHKSPMIWRPRMYKEKQQMAIIIEAINDLLEELRELKNDLKMTQQISIHGSSIQMKTANDCKTRIVMNGH